MEQRIYSVSDLNRAVKETLESNVLFRRLWVEGEISNFRHHTSGHMYFTLKDDASRLRCVMFRGRTVRLRFRPEDGMKVVVSGSLTVYEVAGQYQVIAEEMTPAGAGALQAAYEQLKRQLAAEGLFDESRKRPMPTLPRKVAIVTSPTGAALRDIVSVIRRRFPPIDVVLAPAIVQGEAGPDSVVAAIDRLNRFSDADVMIVGRGGGSLEELWTFNDERVARAIAASRIPVIAAVGHETDVTIADFVADRRAATPSVAAEIAVPEWSALVRELNSHRMRLQTSVERHMKRARDRVNLLIGARVLMRPTDGIDQKRLHVDDMLHRLTRGARHAWHTRQQRFDGLAGKLHSLSPLGTLARGYAVCRLKETGQTVTDVAQVAPGQALRLTLKKGELTCVAAGGDDQTDG